jgi:hypothetical protein
MITFRVGVSLSPFFEYTGKWFSIILGLFFILGRIKAFIGTVFRAFQVEGWSWKTFTNIWSTWFHLVMLPWNLVIP